MSDLFSVREKGKKKGIFGFAFLKPLRSDGTTIVDDRHQLVFYKVILALLWNIKITLLYSAGPYWKTLHALLTVFNEAACY
jgi:hypothetical protein